MGKVKTLLWILLYFMTIGIYVVLPVFFNFEVNIILAVVLIAMLILSNIRRIINIFKRANENKIANILVCTLNTLFIGVIGFTTIRIGEIYKEEDKTIVMYEILEKHDMNMASFNGTLENEEKDNYKIVSTKKLESELNRIDLILEKAVALNNKVFGDFSKSEVTIKFDHAEANINSKDTSGGFGGMYLPHTKEIYIYGNDDYDDIVSVIGKMELDASLIHEYTHHVMFEFFNKNKIDPTTIPSWVIEGFAQYISEGFIMGDINEIVPLNKLTTNEKWKDTLKENKSIYAQSQYAISKLVMLKGEEAIKEIILKSGDSDFNTAFEEIMDISIENFEDIMEIDLDDEFKKYHIEADKIQKNKIKSNKFYLDIYIEDGVKVSEENKTIYI